MGWNYLSISSIPKLQQCSHWSLGMDKRFVLTFYWTCEYLSMLRLKLIHVNKRGTSCFSTRTKHNKEQNMCIISWMYSNWFDVFWILRKGQIHFYDQTNHFLGNYLILPIWYFNWNDIPIALITLMPWLKVKAMTLRLQYICKVWMFCLFRVFCDPIEIPQ